jgi:hypothetical protein
MASVARSKVKRIRPALKARLYNLKPVDPQLGLYPPSQVVI